MLIMPKPLDLTRLKQFEPAPKEIEQKALLRHEDDTHVRWPSREPVRDGQLSIKGPMSTIQKFKTMCKDDRRTYIDMLGILMDAFERSKNTTDTR
jgi:hypothetical protein